MDAARQRLACSYPDGLGIDILVELLDARLSTVTAHLVASKGHRRVHRLVAINPDRAGANRLRESMRLGDVAGSDTATEAEDGAVRALDQSVYVVKGESGDYGPKDLFLRYLHVVADIGKDGGLHEISGFIFAFDHSRSTGKGSSAFLLAASR